MSMRHKVDLVVVLALALCAVVVVGEYCTYYSDIHEYGSTATWSDGRVDYTVSSSGSDVFSAILLENDGRKPVTDLCIFIDDGYMDHYAEAHGLSGAVYLDQEYYAKQVWEALRFRGFSEVIQCSSSEISDYLRSTLSDPSGHALMVMSYSLPSEVYDGTDGCLLLEWMSEGGALYWLGSEVGRFYTDGSSLVEVSGNQELFFGVRCIHDGSMEVADTKVDNGFTDAFRFKNSSLQFALDSSVIDGAISMGYSLDGYSSIVFVPFGSGQICVFSGNFDVNQIDDIGQVIASGLTVDSEISCVQEGKVVRGTIEGSIDVPRAGCTLYIYTGGFYMNHGEAFHG